MDRLITFVAGGGFLGLAWLMATRESWTTDGARTLLLRRPQSRLRKLNLWIDVVLTRIIVPAVVGIFGLWALIAALID